MPDLHAAHQPDPVRTKSDPAGGYSVKGKDTASSHGRLCASLFFTLFPSFHPAMNTPSPQRAAHSDTVEKLARFGYAVKGVVYGLIGVLAVMAATGSGGETSDSRGVLHTIAGGPFGQILIGAVAIGLFGYALWRFIQALVDPDHKGSDAEGLVKRVGYFISGVLYAGLGLAAARLLLGNGGSGGGNSADTWTAKLMAQPFGVWLVGIVGAIIIGVGLYQIYKAYKAKFMDKLKTGEMSATERTWAERLGRFGLSARGVVFSIIGVFLILAAVNTNPEEARGLEGALDTLAAQPYGPYLLGLVALGLVAYGIYCGVLARYRRIPAGT